LGQIAAKEFVSVQPMNLPSGLVFYLDFQYGTSKSPFTAGQSQYMVPVLMVILHSVMVLQVVFMVLVVLVTQSTTQHL
jgi:hypothetical protein